MKTDIMIDLETLDTIDTSIVISIGACLFDIKKGTIGSTFYMAMDIQDQMTKGRTISASTLKWWFGQSDAAKKVFHEQALPPVKVLNTMLHWMNVNVPSKKDRVVWGNGSSFDISIMENIFKDYTIGVPWNYSGINDLRTFKRHVAKDAPLEFQGVAHNALDDAINQAKYVILHSQPQGEVSNDNEGPKQDPS